MEIVIYSDISLKNTFIKNLILEQAYSSIQKLK